MQLVGLGAAGWAYAFGPTVESDGRCFDVDGTLTLSLQSDGSTISGPLTGLSCPVRREPGTRTVGRFRTAAPSWRTTHTNDNSLIPDWGSGVREEADMRRTLGRIRGRGVRRRCSAADSSKGEGG
jgi:hypothetical protein